MSSTAEELRRARQKTALIGTRSLPSGPSKAEMHEQLAQAARNTAALQQGKSKPGDKTCA